MSNYWEKYQTTIAARLREIDLYLRTTDPPYPPETVAGLLEMPKEQVWAEMRRQNLSLLDRSGFFLVMREGKSPVCRMFARELERGLPSRYTPGDVSYIYDIDIDRVLDACAGLGLTAFDPIMLQLLLYSIPD